MIDQFGRDVNYLRLSVTDKCNLKCLYCVPEFSKEIVNESKLLTIDEYFRILPIKKKLVKFDQFYLQRDSIEYYPVDIFMNNKNFVHIKSK